MAQLDTHQANKVYRGTIDKVFSHRSEIPPGAIVELKVVETTPATDEDTGAFGGKSLADLIEEIGTVNGLPADLSANPSYLQREATAP